MIRRQLNVVTSTAQALIAVILNNRLPLRGGERATISFDLRFAAVFFGTNGLRIVLAPLARVFAMTIWVGARPVTCLLVDSFGVYLIPLSPVLLCMFGVSLAPPPVILLLCFVVLSRPPARGLAVTIWVALAPSSRAISGTLFTTSLAAPFGRAALLAWLTILCRHNRKRSCVVLCNHRSAVVDYSP